MQQNLSAVIPYGIQLGVQSEECGGVTERGEIFPLFSLVGEEGSFDREVGVEFGGFFGFACRASFKGRGGLGGSFHAVHLAEKSRGEGW